MSEGQEAHRTSYAVVATTAAAPERDPVLNKSFAPRALANKGASVGKSTWNQPLTANQPFVEKSMIDFSTFFNLFSTYTTPF